MARRAARLGAPVLGALVLAACSGTPTAPGPSTPPPPTPPPANTAPVIGGITLQASRVEVDQPITVVGEVQDAETAPTALTYEWAASAGVVTGSGRSVTWALPKGSANTPANVILTLTVVEPYQALVNGQIVTREHRVTATSGVIRAHDSVAEIGKMALRFLIDLFGDSTVTPEQAVVDFSDTCVAGKRDELQDIVDNRRDLTVLFADARMESVTVAPSRLSAQAAAHCTFRDFVKETGQRRTADGTCNLTAVYEQSRWWLCTSTFDGTLVDSDTGQPLSRFGQVYGYR